MGGIVATAGEREPPGSAELVGLAAAAVILLIAFGSVTAAGLPILTALLALIPAFFLIGIGASFVNLADFTPQFAAMIGIGVGIDYALLIVTRFREALARGMTVPDAVAKAASTAGHSVLFAGCSVVIALMGLWAIGVPLLSLTAMGPALSVALAAIVALFVLPAILAVVGHRVNQLTLPGLHVNPIQDEGGMGYRLSRLIQRAPWLWLIVATAGMLVLAYPALDVRLGASDTGSNPTSLTSRRSYDLLAEGFGVGFNGRIVIGAALDTSEQVDAFETLPAQLAVEENVVRVSPAVLNEERSAGTIVLIPGSSPQDERTDELVHRLRERLPELLADTGAEALVGGATAIFIDIGDRVTSRMPIFLGAVIGASFLLLMVVFRSLVVPVKAALMNVLAAGAAYGILVAIFQWGLGSGSAGARRHGPDRVVPADDDVRGAVRPLDGLRGVPREPRARGVPGHGRQRRGGSARPLRHEPRYLGGGGDHGGGLPELRAQRPARDQGVRHRAVGRHLPRRDGDPADPRAGGHAAHERRELVAAGLAGSHRAQPRLRRAGGAGGAGGPGGAGGGRALAPPGTHLRIVAV